MSCAVVEEHAEDFFVRLEEQGASLPTFVHEEFARYVRCGRLEEGVLSVRCEACHAEPLVAFSCTRRGFCSSCRAWRMAESAALLVDDILPELPVRQWVVTFPHARSRVALGLMCAVRQTDRQRLRGLGEFTRPRTVQ